MSLCSRYCNGHRYAYHRQLASGIESLSLEFLASELLRESALQNFCINRQPQSLQSSLDLGFDTGSVLFLCFRHASIVNGKESAIFEVAPAAVMISTTDTIHFALQIRVSFARIADEEP